MSVDKKKLYKYYISKLEESLEKDNFEWINYILEYVYSVWLSENEITEIDDILQEATIYAELKEKEYKDEALQQISEFKEEINILN